VTGGLEYLSAEGLNAEPEVFDLNEPHPDAALETLRRAIVLIDRHLAGAATDRQALRRLLSEARLSATTLRRRGLELLAKAEQAETAIVNLRNRTKALEDAVALLKTPLG
jgi:hypothetical protein